MGRKIKQEVAYRAAVNVGVPQKLRQRLIKYATDNDMTISEAVRKFLEKELKANGY